jgi:hypothetical protein
MKSYIILIFVLCLALMACQSEDEAPAATLALTQAAAQAESNTPAPTNTRPVFPTLPPAASLQVSSATAGPSRTAAPSLTPAPTRTSNLMIAVSPEATRTPIPTDEAATEAAIAGPVINLAYGDFTAKFTGYTAPFDEDESVQGPSIALTLEATGIQLKFDVLASDSEDPISITADVIFEFRDGFITARLGAIYETENPGTPYENQTIIEAMSELLQRALDELLIEVYANQVGGEVDELGGFAVTDLQITDGGLSIRTTGQ